MTALSEMPDTPEAVENESANATAAVARTGARKRPKSGNPGGAARGPAAQPGRVNPVLEKLAGFYPALFGEVFLPLKRGIFEELLAAHPDDLEREALKEALSQHTRST